MKAIALTTLAAAAGLATAAPVLQTGLTNYSVDNAGAATATITVDVSGLTFNDAQGSALNQMLAVGLAVGAEVTGIGWDVTLTTFGASWASEAVLNFEGQIFLTVGSADGGPVSNMAYSSGGIIDLSDDVSLPNITLGGDGVLNVEAFDSFVDNGGAGDAVFEQGSVLYLAVKGVPAPGSLAILGLGGLVAGRRRR